MHSTMPWPGAFRRPNLQKSSSTVAAVLAASALLAGCTNVTPDATPEWAQPQKYQPMLPQGAIFEPAGSVKPELPLTEGLLGSLAPDDKKPEERVPDIVARGRIIVGVDQSQNLLSFRDATSGELKGFEVDLAKEIAYDIFGDPNKVDFRYISSANTAVALENSSVDIVIRGVPITRDAQDLVAFSTPYLAADIKMLVLESSGISSVEDLNDRTACAVDGSNGLAYVRETNPNANIMKVAAWADCLVLLQQNVVDAIISDTAILSGIAAQDPYTRIVGPSISQKRYGVAIAKPGSRHQTDGLVRQVNSTLERVRNDGTWWKMYNTWLAKYQTTAGPPAPSYRDEGKP